MVVDDEADAISLVTRIMEDCGASVKACTSGAECLNCLPTIKPDADHHGHRDAGYGWVCADREDQGIDA